MAMRNTILLSVLFIFFVGCTPKYHLQSEMIKEYEQVIDGVKTDLKMKILNIDRVATKPLDSLYYRKNDFEKVWKKIEDNKLKEAQFPIFKVTYKIFNPILKVDQELTKYYAFDPQMRFIISDWNVK